MKSAAEISLEGVNVQEMLFAVVETVEVSYKSLESHEERISDLEERSQEPLLITHLGPLGFECSHHRQKVSQLAGESEVLATLSGQAPLSALKVQGYLDHKKHPPP